MKRIITLTLGSVILTGCNGVVLAGSSEGIRSFYDGHNGLVSNARISPDKKSAHWILREEEERQRTTREVKGGLLGKLSSLLTPRASED